MAAPTRATVEVALERLAGRLTAMQEAGADVGPLFAQLSAVRDQLADGQVALAAEVVEELGQLTGRLARGQADAETVAAEAARAGARFYRQEQLSAQLHAVLEEGGVIERAVRTALAEHRGDPQADPERVAAAVVERLRHQAPVPASDELAGAVASRLEGHLDERLAGIQAGLERIAGPRDHGPGAFRRWGEQLTSVLGEGLDRLLSGLQALDQEQEHRAAQRHDQLLAGVAAAHDENELGDRLEAALDRHFERIAGELQELRSVLEERAGSNAFTTAGDGRVSGDTIVILDPTNPALARRQTEPSALAGSAVADEHLPTSEVLVQAGAPGTDDPPQVPHRGPAAVIDEAAVQPTPGGSGGPVVTEESRSESEAAGADDDGPAAGDHHGTADDEVVVATNRAESAGPEPIPEGMTEGFPVEFEPASQAAEGAVGTAPSDSEEVAPANGLSAGADREAVAATEPVAGVGHTGSEPGPPAPASVPASDPGEPVEDAVPAAPDGHQALVEGADDTPGAPATETCADQAVAEASGEIASDGDASEPAIGQEDAVDDGCGRDSSAAAGDPEPIVVDAPHQGAGQEAAVAPVTVVAEDEDDALLPEPEGLPAEAVAASAEASEPATNITEAVAVNTGPDEADAIGAATPEQAFANALLDPDGGANEPAGDGPRAAPGSVEEAARSVAGPGSEVAGQDRAQEETAMSGNEQLDQDDLDQLLASLDAGGGGGDEDDETRAAPVVDTQSLSEAANALETGELDALLDNEAAGGSGGNGVLAESELNELMSRIADRQSSPPVVSIADDGDRPPALPVPSPSSTTVARVMSQGVVDQDEIDALLNGAGSAEAGGSSPVAQDQRDVVLATTAAGGGGDTQAETQEDDVDAALAAALAEVAEVGADGAETLPTTGDDVDPPSRRLPAVRAADAAIGELEALLGSDSMSVEVEDPAVSSIADTLADTLAAQSQVERPQPGPTVPEEDDASTRLATAVLRGGPTDPGPSRSAPAPAPTRAWLREALREELPELLRDEEVRQALFAVFATEAVARPSALGELTGLRHFLRQELERVRDELRDEVPA